MKKIICFTFLLVFTVVNGFSQGRSLSGVRIYINPGHGGFDSDDRNVSIAPFFLGDTAGFWESKSNLAKGLHLKKLLESEGATVIMSRVQNRTTDDRSLSAIAEEANANQADFMISIHSNAYNGVTNYVLELFHGWDNNPIRQQSLDLANLFWENLISNQVAHWTYRSRNVRGDKSFAPASWNGYGVLRPLMVPGLISEGSFHDYLPETYRLMNAEYKQVEAWHFFRAFCQYYGGNPGTKGKIAGFVKDDSRYVTGYTAIAGTKDQWQPVNQAMVTLLPDNIVYKVDNLNNGFFLFDNLPPGNYRLKFEAEHYASFISDELKTDSAQITWYLCYLNRSTGSSLLKNTARQDREFRIYPNPANRSVSFTVRTADGTYPFRLTAVSGKIMFSGMVRVDGEKGTIELPVLAGGICLLDLILDDKVVHAPLVIRQE